MPKRPVPKFTGNGKKEKNRAQNDLRDWMAQMVEWGENVRLDIIRLEGAAHLAHGDPGQPPEDPWE